MVEQRILILDNYFAFDYMQEIQDCRGLPLPYESSTTRNVGMSHCPSMARAMSTST